MSSSSGYPKYFIYDEDYNIVKELYSEEEAEEYFGRTWLSIRIYLDSKEFINGQRIKRHKINKI